MCGLIIWQKKSSFDHAAYYETCVCARTYSEHMSKKTFLLENIKPLFDNEKFLSLCHIHAQHTFIELFEIIKEGKKTI